MNGSAIDYRGCFLARRNTRASLRDMLHWNGRSGTSWTRRPLLSSSAADATRCRHESRREVRGRPRGTRHSHARAPTQRKERAPILRSRSGSSCRSRPAAAPTISRARFSPALSAALGQPLVIDNRGGASSVIGTELAARAPADGYTMLLVTTTHTVNPSLIEKLPYDTIRDFAPVSLAVSQPNILAVHPSVPAKSVKELVALREIEGARTSRMHRAAAAARRISPASSSGSSLAIDLTHVPFKGSGPGVDCAARRPGHDDVRRPALVRAAHQIRQASRARRRGPQALVRSCPMFRRWPKRAFPASRPARGTASSRLPRRQPRSCRRFTRPS